MINGDPWMTFIFFTEMSNLLEGKRLGKINSGLGLI